MVSRRAGCSIGDEDVNCSSCFVSVGKKEAMETTNIFVFFSAAFEYAGVAALVLGALAALFFFLSDSVTSRRLNPGQAYHNLRRNLAKAIMLGLELLVVADIIRSVAIDPTFTSVGVLGILVVVRTFLSWSLEVEINGEWPWQRFRSHQNLPADPRDL